MSNDLEHLLAAARRQWKVVAVSIAVAIALGIAYVATAVPLYTASIHILVGQLDSKLLEQIADTGPSAGGDDSAMQSEVELFKSEEIRGRVVDLLELTKDPRFYAPDGSPIDNLRGMIRSLLDVEAWFSSAEVDGKPDEEAKRFRAIEKLGWNSSVERVGRARVISLNYTSPSPELAADVARAFGEAYLADQVQSKFEAVQAASGWLEKRVQDLKKRALESDLAVQQFRAKNDLIATNGVLVTEQNLSQLNTRLVDAQAETAQAQARFDRIQSIIAAGDTDAIVTDALDSSLVNQLRGKYLEAAKREAEISSQLGSGHIGARRLREEMAEYRKQIFSELGRISESYQSDLQVAKLREESIRNSVTAATSVTATTNSTMVELRELERTAETYRAMYESSLQLYQEAVQRQSFPVTDARVITQAKVPNFPSHPRSSLIMALAIVLGGAVGVGIGAFREFRDRFFRTADQIRDELGLEHLGNVPMVIGGDTKKTSDEENFPHARALYKPNPISSFALDHPHSEFADTLWTAWFTVDMALANRRPRVVGIVSLLPSEGKSTVAINYAEITAKLGIRTLLIDADLRNPGLTRAVAGHAEYGLVDLVLGRQTMKDLLFISPATKLAMLPACGAGYRGHTAELLASAGMTQAIEQASGFFEQIVIDLPPMGLVRDARAMAPKIDAFILVVEWGKTARQALRTTLASEPAIAERCVGVILNKVDSDKMKLYGSFGTSEYYQSRYKHYHDTGLTS
ncbi:polysaccharide biosynthesis tyrosine autokinase [Chthonobacter albigriseus]|uniref:polysaccharide biosynthesis tyrosine autokinase n=1 Tax=Chthonobacter albigriseus TaxID=1683161 RepID=UPI001FCE9CD5|nr:polysaccharide biosynthesis tyrosine autokinase [Chthonobacter albigriseus]